MKKALPHKKSINRKIAKTVLWVLVAIFTVFLLLVAALQIPSVQTEVLQRLSRTITEKTGFATSIDQVHIKWFDTAVLDSIAIYDEQNCPMILIEQLTVDFDIRTVWEAGNIYLDEARVENGELYLYKDTVENELNITTFVERIKALTRKKNKPPSERYPEFVIREVVLDNVDFSYYDAAKEILTDRFDYQHFSIKDINANARQLRVIADTLEVDIQQMSGYEPAHDFPIHNLRAFYWFSDQTMAFEGLELQAGRSILRDSVVFNYASKNSLGFFNDSVTIAADFRNTQLHTSDLSLFAPSLQAYQDEYVISGDFRGKIVDFTIKDLLFEFGSRSRLIGKVSFTGLPELAETFTELNLKRSTVAPQDLRQYINDPSAYQTARKFGQVDFSAQFVGFPNDFVANGKFNTALGKIASDINLKLEKKPIYSGRLALQDFDLGTLTGRPDLLQKTSFEGNLVGSGVTIDDASVKLEAAFAYLGVKGYTYQNVTTDATLAKSFFEGALSIADPNLRFVGNGTVDLRENREHIRIEAQLDTAFLKPLHLTDKEVFISTELRADTHGLQVDSLVGNARFDNLFISYDGRPLSIDTLSFISKYQQGYREFALSTERVKANMSGNFQFTTLINDLGKLVEEYRLIFRNDEEKLQTYYAQKEAKAVEDYQDQQYEINYTLDLQNANPVLNLFVPDMALSPDVLVEGRIVGGYTNIFSLRTNIDTVRYQDHYFYRNTVDVTTSKIADSADVLATAYLHSDYQDLASNKLNAQMRDLTVEAIWADDHIDFQQSIAQRGTNNYANLSGELIFLEDSTQIRVDPSTLQVLDRQWSFSDNNIVTLTNQEVYFSDFFLYNQPQGGERQEVSVFGALSSDPDKQLTLRIDHFLVDNLNPVLTENYQGEVNGLLDVKNFFTNQENEASSFVLDSEFSVSNFSINGFKVGNIISLVNWDNRQEQLDVNLMVDRERQRIITLKGNYDPKEEYDQLDLQASFQKANINVVEPFVDEIFSDIRGAMSGNFTVTGQLSHPVLLGDGNITSGHIKINYLNTDYTINGGLFLDENTIGVKDLVLRDERNQPAILNGGIFHDGFANFVLDIKGELNNVVVLNTTLKDNSLFYGKGFATGTMSILGPIDNLNISTRATTQKGTRIYIPVGGTEGVEQSEFISFVDYSDSTIAAVDTVGKVDLTGLSLDLEIEITPDAYAEIIFDARTGDIIRGRGEGQLEFRVSSEGEFGMFGDLRMVEGGYNFTLYNVINKEFTIQPGSSISWRGDPYGGILDIQAIYDQMASLAPLMASEEDRQDGEVRRKYQAQVVLDITGALMAPDIDFEINVQNYPENNPLLQTAVESLKNNLTQNKEELKRQVFSLIVLRRFSEQGSFGGDGSNALSSSVSELLSNQFSYWLSQVDENLEIDVDLGTFDDDRFNTFQLRLSYTLFDGRLRITRDGGFTNVNNQTSTASVIGDVMVEYMLTTDGKYRVKIYNRSNFNTVAQALNQNFNATQGVSLLYVESFDKVSDLLNETRSGTLKQPIMIEQPKPPITSSDAPPPKQAENRTSPEAKPPIKELPER